VDVDSTGFTSVDDTDTGFKIYGGYEFTKNFALEAGYADLGKATAEDSTFPLSAAVEASAIFLDAVGTLPLTNEFSVFGRAGIAFTKVEASVSVPGFGSASVKEDETNLKFGLGAQYAFTKNVALRAEWERYMDLGEDATTGESDVDMVGVSLNVKF
jgi:OOP family OmpA-OmpF porin